LAPLNHTDDARVITTRILRQNPKKVAETSSSEGSPLNRSRSHTVCLEIARNQHAKMLELRAATSLAKFWQKRSQLDDAKRVLKSVYSGFTEGLETPDLIEAKTVLDQL
jgi:hypothetical protein